MRVAISAITPDKMAAPEYYRGVLPAKAAGAEVISTKFAISGKDVYSWTAEGEKILIDHDVVQFCRPGAIGQKQMVERLQHNGVAVVVDIDDDYQGIQPNHSAWKVFQPKYSPDFNWKISKEICAMADLVTCTTPALMNIYAKHGRGKVIPNYIDESWLDITHTPRETIIWPGYTGNHPDDLKQVGDGVQKFQRDTGWTLFHLGKGDIPFPYDKFEFERWCPIEEYPHEFAKHGMAIAPLADSRFNESKSWLKVLEAAALGLPVVCSPSPDYIRINQLGLGILANKPRKWYTGLKQAYENYDDYSKRGREIASELTIQKHIQEWKQAWQSSLTQT